MRGSPLLLQIYTQVQRGQAWLDRYQGNCPAVVCVLGFTETGLIPGISAAGATPEDRRYTAIADAEFLYHGCQPSPVYPLPPLTIGASPVLISRAIVAALDLPLYLFNAGLPVPPVVPALDLGGQPARCVGSGEAMPLPVVQGLLEQGLRWGTELAARHDYLILGECVVGGTTTALAVLTGLGINGRGKINSSLPQCNHDQKWAIVEAGLGKLASQVQGATPRGRLEGSSWDLGVGSPLAVVAAVGDPMQVFVAGMAIAASRRCGVLLAGGTQMLAVYALMRAIAQHHALDWEPTQVVVGTTRWVVEDQSGDTVGLAQAIGEVPLLATQLSLGRSRFGALRAYDQGYVKEGVGAGGCAIAASLYKGWGQDELLGAIDALAATCQAPGAATILYGDLI